MKEQFVIKVRNILPHNEFRANH